MPTKSKPILIAAQSSAGAFLAALGRKAGK